MCKQHFNDDGKTIAHELSEATVMGILDRFGIPKIERFLVWKHGIDTIEHVVSPYGFKSLINPDNTSCIPWTSKKEKLANLDEWMVLE
jgi:hypothetical protein